MAFGLAPVLLISTHLTVSSEEWIALGVCLVAALGRLVRSCLTFVSFHDHYIGLPMPAAGALLLGMVFVLRGVPVSLGAIVVSVLAVCWIHYPHLSWLSKHRPWLLAGLVLGAAAGSLLSPWMALLFTASGYAALPWLQTMPKAVHPLPSDRS